MYTQDARRKQMVVATSPLAQLEGVQVDTPLTEAKALLSRAAHQSSQKQLARQKHQARQKQSQQNRTPHQKSASPDQPASTATHAFDDPFFRIFQHVPQDDVEALKALAAELDTFSPIVGLQTGTEQPDCIFLDITGLASLFDGEATLSQEVLRFCQSLGYLGRIGIAHTIGLAQGIAQHATNQQKDAIIISEGRCNQLVPNQSVPTSQYVNEEQSSGDKIRHDKDALSTDDSSGDDPRQYFGLPIESLRLSHSITRTLYQLGIFRIEQLLQVPRKELFSRFGNEIYTRIDQMSGLVEEPIQACPRPKEFYAEQLLDHPTNHKETIEVILERLITRICEQLRSSQQGALQWTMRLYGQQKLPVKLHVRLFAPTAVPDQIIQLARMQLELVLQPELIQQKKKKLTQTDEDKPKKSKKEQWLQLDGKSLDVNEITVTVTSSVLMENRQRQLFDENPRTDKQALAFLINRLSGRLGHRNVVVPSMVSGNQPEYSYQLKPLVHSGGRQNQNSTVDAHSSHVMARPLRMFHPPQPIDVVALSPDRGKNDEEQFMRPVRPAVPVVITLEDQKQKVIRQWGPERIETGWWRGRLVRRDYWKVETQSNQQFWIYFDLRHRRWFLHGEF